MSSVYKIIYSISPDLYIEGSPVIIRSAALVQNTQNQALHMQAKFQNIVDKDVVYLKAKFSFLDTLGRKIGETEKEYFDFAASKGGEFGAKVPVKVLDITTRQISVCVTEVGYSDHTLWKNEREDWVSIPERMPIQKKFSDALAFEEFKQFYCARAQIVPFVHKDIWFCACGGVNANTQEKCCVCGAVLADMQAADSSTLKNTRLYRQAKAFSMDNAQSLRARIKMLSELGDWEDSTKLLEEANNLLPVIVQKEKEERERVLKEKAETEERQRQEAVVRNSQKKKRKMISSIIAAACCVIAIAVVVIIECAIVLPASKKLAQEYKTAQICIENCEYDQAMEILGGIKDYKNAEKLYLDASDLKDENYLAYIERNNLNSFSIPKNIEIIKRGAFSYCNDLESVVIPKSVTTIEVLSFNECANLKCVYYSGTKYEWNEITIGGYNDKLKNATRYYYSESAPTTSGLYWHYVNGEPTSW